ncbi:MAG: xanthine dehydrogenase family protein molybdopterin-binding subunit [Acidimicrobiales bacterium]
MSILGNSVVRVEDPRFLTHGGRYVADVFPEGAAHVVFVRSTASNGEILEIDGSDALEAPGVIAVLTAADLDIQPFGGADTEHLSYPCLASGRVFFAGQPVVAIVAESESAALDAAELVFVDIEAEDAVTTIDQALTDDVVVHPALGTNVVDDKRATPLDFSGCEIVVEAEIVNSRVNGAAIEPRVAAAEWGADGRLTCWTSTQGAHPAQAAIARVLGVDRSTVRVVTADVGGSFGSKATPGPEECSLGAIARMVGRPVAWAETRTENFLAMGHARSQKNHIRIGGTANGRITHYQLDITQEAGAFPGSTAFLPYFTMIMATGVYDIAHAACGWVTVTTNVPPTVAFRGAGRPEATATLERAVDLFAAEVELDPTDVRRRNMIRSDAFPFTTPMGQTYDSGDYHAALDRALEAAGYEGLRAEQAVARGRGDSILLGIGVASYVEITAPNPAPGQTEFGSVTLLPDGSLLARTGSTPYGQGHETTWAMIVSERTGVPIERIRVEWGDTDIIPSSNVTGGSRSVQLAGSSIADASEKLVDKARQLAATMLEANVDDMVLDHDAGRFHVAGSPTQSVGWDEVATAEADALIGVGEFGQDGSTFPFGTHVAIVEVDTDTGGVQLRQLVTVDDAGTLINPLLAAGQLHGGIAAGVSQALFEEVTYDEFGNLTTASFADYALPAASEFPNFDITITETPTPLNPLGAKGIGEAGSIGATPAVQNAVIDALAHLGVRHIDMPMTPAKVWATYSNASASTPE